jgi:hypothetical protein
MIVLKLFFIHYTFKLMFVEKKLPETFQSHRPYSHRGFMMIRMVYVLLLILQIGVYSCSRKSRNAQGLVLVCGDSKVLLVDYVNSYDSIPNIIWSWDAHMANDLPDIYRTQKFNSIDDCKPIHNGSQIMISSSSGAVAIVNIEDKKILFYADVPNAHSIEILPGNKLIAAASTSDGGNRLMLFSIDNPAKLLFSDSLYSAHGVVWDKKRNSLFALGYDVLREYKMEDEDNLNLKNEWTIPGISGHDLQMAQDGNKLLVTEHTGAWIFDLEDHQFSKINGFPDAENIKSLNQNRKGEYVYTVPEERWWTYRVLFFNPSGALVFPNMRVYKARWYEN